MPACRVVEGGEWEWKVVADKVSVTAMLPQIKRCQSFHAEAGQCDLRDQHEGKHLGGMLMWEKP